jgi:hypothetical protein
MNVLLGRSEVHFFTDGGNYEGSTLELRDLGGKIHFLPAWGAAIAWCGPVGLGHSLLRATEKCHSRDLPGLLHAVPALAEGCAGGEAYSVIVAGVLGGAALAVAAEEGGRSQLLGPGHFVKSIPSLIDFDAADVRGSGLAMVRDQRRSGVVHGFCVWTVVEEDSLRSEVVERWPR